MFIISMVQLLLTILATVLVIVAIVYMKKTGRNVKSTFEEVGKRLSALDCRVEEIVRELEEKGLL